MGIADGGMNTVVCLSAICFHKACQMKPEDILIPTSIASAVMLGLLLIVRRDWIVPIATAAAMLTGMYLISKPAISYLPKSAELWLFWKILPICLFTLPLLYSPLPIRLAVLLILSAEAFGQIFSTFVGRWNGQEAILWITGLSAGTTLVWFALERLALRTKDWSVYLSLILIFACAAGVVGMGASSKFGRIGGILSAIVLVSVLFSLIFRNPAFVLAGLMSWSVLLIILLAIGFFLNDTKPLHALLIISAVGFAWLGQLPAIERMGGWGRFITRMILVLVPLGLAVGLALPKFIENMKGELY